jgi:hypothetical protein
MCSGDLSARAVRKPSAKAISEEVLIASIAKHDKNAMHTLSVCHHVREFRFLTRFVRDAAAAEGLAGEAFIEIWRHAAQYRSRAKARPGSWASRGGRRLQSTVPGVTDGAARSG